MYILMNDYNRPQVNFLKQNLIQNTYIKIQKIVAKYCFLVYR